VIVLDTHVLLWWAAGQRERLTPRALQAIDDEAAGGQVLVSAISAWEIAMLVHRGRLTLAMGIADWLATVERIDPVRFVPVDNGLAVRSVALPGEFHKDPADRLIVATAHRYAVPLVTADEKIHAYPHVQAVW
jgi:PIN domain nuclease of toxin-antitoxin system